MPAGRVPKIPTNNHTYYSQWDIEFVFREAANLDTMAAVHFTLDFCKLSKAAVPFALLKIERLNMKYSCNNRHKKLWAGQDCLKYFKKKKAQNCNRNEKGR